MKHRFRSQGCEGGKIMFSLGIDHPFYASILFVIFAIIASALFVFQLIFLQKLSILPVYALPLISICICLENCVSYQGTSITSDSTSAYAAYFFHSVEFPLFIIVMFEVALRLHEARSAHFWCLPFDQGAEVTNIPSLISLWIVRIIAIGLFVMNIFVLYGFDSTVTSSTSNASKTGFPDFDSNRDSRLLWLSLVPSLVLSGVCFYSSIAIYR